MQQPTGEQQTVKYTNKYLTLVILRIVVAVREIFDRLIIN